MSFAGLVQAAVISNGSVPQAMIQPRAVREVTAIVPNPTNTVLTPATEVRSSEATLLALGGAELLDG